VVTIWFLHAYTHMHYHKADTQLVYKQECITIFINGKNTDKVWHVLKHFFSTPCLIFKQYCIRSFCKSRSPCDNVLQILTLDTWKHQACTGFHFRYLSSYNFHNNIVLWYHQPTVVNEKSWVQCWCEPLKVLNLFIMFLASSTQML
jgi:hypothetical protein